MRKRLKWVLISLGIILLLVILSISIFILSKSRERISFFSLNPRYKLIVNKDILKQVMETSPDGQSTTWSRGGDKFAARKVWVIIDPGPASAYPTGIKHINNQENIYSYRWLEKGNTDFLYVRVNDEVWKNLIPLLQTQLLSWMIFPEIATRYPTGGITAQGVSLHLGNIYPETEDFPLKIRSNF